MQQITMDGIDSTKVSEFVVPGMRTEIHWFPEGPTVQRQFYSDVDVLTFNMRFGEQFVVSDTFEGTPRSFVAGPLMFWPQNSVWESTTGGCRMLSVIARFDEDAEPGKSGEPLASIRIDDFSMMELMTMLRDEVRAPSANSSDVVRAVADILRVKLQRLTRTDPGPPIDVRTKPTNDLALIDDLVRSGNGPLPSVSEIARQCRMSRRNLLRRVRKQSGRSLMQYIDEVRIDKAKTLLATSPMSLKQIAYDAGFSTASSFSCKFRQATGATPSAFRKVHR